MYCDARYMEKMSAEIGALQEGEDARVLRKIEKRSEFLLASLRWGWFWLHPRQSLLGMTSGSQSFLTSTGCTWRMVGWSPLKESLVSADKMDVRKRSRKGKSLRSAN